MSKTRLTRMQFNERKRQALSIFARRGWLNPPAWAMLAGFRPVRAAYTYLLRLHRWGLLERGNNLRGLVIYRLTARGRSRLKWLDPRYQG
jgi:hypothetical protein